MIIDFTYKDVKKYLPNKKIDSNKYDSGQLLIIGGDENYPGAIILAAKMAVMSGVGLVYLYTKNQNVIKVLKEIPEIIVLDQKNRLNELLSYNIPVLAGPGTINNKWTKDTYGLMKNKPLTTILDAAFMEQIKSTNSLKIKILLPHEGEAARLLNLPSSLIKKDRLNSAIKLSIKFNAMTVLKGPQTLITDGKKTFRCLDGSSVLSTAGTGDILAGLISSFLAQGLSPMNSCKLGVAIHGHCADESNLKSGLMPSELIHLIRNYINQL